MGRTGRRALALLVAALSMAVVVGCGSSDDDSDSGSSGGGKSGGSITISQTSNPDFLDPALAYTVEASEPHWIIYTGLMAYRHAEGKEGAELIPGAADAEPEVSADGKTYKFTLRKGMKYSDGTPAKASDFEHTIQRSLTLEWGGLSFFEVIQGVDKYVKDKKEGADISGITSNNATGEITIKLTEANGQFPYILAFPSAGLVPTKTSYKNLSKDPPPGLGAYQFEKGSIQPNRQYVLVKNPNFSIPDIPKGNVDKITVKLVKSQARQAEDVISGKLDWMLDEPSTDLLPEIRAKYTGDRYEENTANSTYYMFMNTQTPPFDKLKVRQAANYGFDKRAAVRLFGGLLTPDCNFLPPGMVGYTKIDPCPVGRPERRSRPREGPLTDQGGRSRGREGHGVGRRRGALEEDHRVLHGRPEQDRPGCDAEDHRRGDVLRDDR